MYRISLAFIFSAILTAFLCLSPAFGEEIIRIAFNAIPPWKIERNGQCDGVDVVLLREITRKLNAREEFRIVPFKRGLYEMEYGQADMMSGLLRTPEREAYIHYIEPPYKSRSDKAFYVLKGKRSLIRQYADLYKLTIGISNGARYFPDFDEDEKLKKETVPETSLNVRKLLKGRIDTFITTASQGDYIIHEMGADDKIEQAEFTYQEEIPVYMGISKKSGWINRKSEVEKVVREMVENGITDRLITGYFTEHHLPVPAYK